MEKFEGIFGELGPISLILTWLISAVQWFMALIPGVAS